MANLKDWVLKAADCKPVIAIVVGNMGWADYRVDELPAISQDRTKWNRVLDWETGSQMIDYEFDDGYGSPGCQAITAWTKDRVIFVTECDGATGITWVPRRPVDHKPSMS